MLRKFNKIISFPINLYGFIKKDLTILFKKKKYLYLSISLPLILGLIYILTLTTGLDSINVKICDLDDSYSSEEIASSLRGFNAKIDTSKNCKEIMIEEIKLGKYVFGILIPKGTTDKLNNLQQSKIEIYYDNSEPAISSLASWRADSALVPLKNNLVHEFAEEIKEKSINAKEKTEIIIEIIEYTNNPIISRTKQNLEGINQDLNKISKLDPYFLSNPIRTENYGIHEQFKIIDTGIAPLFVILSLFITLMLCSIGVIYDRKSNLLVRLRASNASNISYIFGKIIFYLGLTIIQFILLFIIFKIFGANYNIEFILLIKAILFISFVNTLIGFLIGIISDSEGVSILISLIITLPMMFLSGMFYPMQLLPPMMKIFTNIIPIQLEIIMMKKALLFSGEINNEIFLIPLVLLIITYISLRKLN